MATTVTLKNPNPQQALAIFHTGGKVLSAGAGSGKTFVLIEHIIYLLGLIKKDISKDEWPKEIPNALSKIVLMTFTKKAAGEMSVRLLKRIDDIVSSMENEQAEYQFWILVRRNLFYLNITTIHGFCYRLLNKELGASFKREIKLVSPFEHREKINKLCQSWFLENQNNLDPIWKASSDALWLAMRDIYSSPELRVLWSNPRLIQEVEIEIDHFFQSFIEVKRYQSLFFGIVDQNIEANEKNKKWFERLVGFEQLVIDNGPIAFKNYHRYYDFFKLFIKFPSLSAKSMLITQKNILKNLKDFRDDLYDLMEDLRALEDNFEIYKKWAATVLDLFKYVEKNYFKIDGFSFADLEYYVYQELNQTAELGMIQEKLSYFIVDEFQDTSFLQFEIIKNLIVDKKERLFSVGDRKQAIYGFRGGELQVFADCSRLVGEENNYFLKDNFRSLPRIVDFNNNLFEIVFPLGIGFGGLDPHPVEMEKQQSNTMEMLEYQGEVISLRTEVLNFENEKIETRDEADDLDQLESMVLVDHLKVLLVNPKINTICVLYRKLKPSAFLLEQLSEQNLPFAAQVKIQFAEDPLINIFLYLIEIFLHGNDLIKKKVSLNLLSTLLAMLEIKAIDLTVVEQFIADVPLIGLKMAFHKFVLKIGLTNSFYMQNAELIDAICRVSKEDIKKTYHLLKTNSNEEYSCEMMSTGGKDGSLKRIVIMSAHASKGLEFDAVLLAGVHTNGRYLGMRDQIGKFPSSFKWKKLFNQKHFFKSPFYHLESEVLKLKDFSESKRLLYVACTRAVKHLAFVDLWKMKKNEPENLYAGDSSWIKGLRLGPATTMARTVSSVNQKKMPVSLIQKDPIGLLAYGGEINLGITSELSVTRLSALAECPFKFYLKNICKLDSEIKLTEALDQVQEQDEFYSSKKRGTKIHDILSKLFLKKIGLEDVVLSDEDRGKVLWAYELGKQREEKFEIISEQMIKFSFFGHMISGTPDLVFIKKEELVIWDFKTGLRHLDNEDGYWFQLMCYAFGLSKITAMAPEDKVELALLYLDQTEIVSRKFSLYQITQLLFSYWKKTESLNQVMVEHCPKCEYSSICKKGEKNIILAN